jgi:hypothetical protein
MARWFGRAGCQYIQGLGSSVATFAEASMRINAFRALVPEKQPLDSFQERRQLECLEIAFLVGTS